MKVEADYARRIMGVGIMHFADGINFIGPIITIMLGSGLP